MALAERGCRIGMGTQIPEDPSAHDGSEPSAPYLAGSRSGHRIRRRRRKHRSASWIRLPESSRVRLLLCVLAVSLVVWTPIVLFLQHRPAEEASRFHPWAQPPQEPDESE